jgi:hypothetical protein
MQTRIQKQAAAIAFFREGWASQPESPYSAALVAVADKWIGRDIPDDATLQEFCGELFEANGEHEEAADDMQDCLQCTVDAEFFAEFGDYYYNWWLQLAKQ